MSEAENKKREERAIDALMVTAFKQELQPEDLDRIESAECTEEDRAALKALGPDIVERIFRGEWKPRGTREESVEAASSTERQLAAAMHRSEDDAKLTEKAREEIERKIQELDTEENGEDSEQ